MASTVQRVPTFLGVEEIYSSAPSRWQALKSCQEQEMHITEFVEKSLVDFPPE